MGLIGALLGAILGVLIMIGWTLDKIHDTLKTKSSLNEFEIKNAIEEALDAQREPWKRE